MKILVITLTALGSVFYTLGAQVQNQSYKLMLHGLLDHSVPEISVQEALGQEQDVFFLDAREKNEFKVSHINGARFIGYNNFKLKAVSGIPKDGKIIVYCSVGYRSEKIAERLIAKGYSDVHNLYGGLFEWKNQDQEVYNEQGKTEKVHAYDETWGIWLQKGVKVYK